MAGVIVTYRTAPAAADENEALAEAVFAELEERRPPGLRYATFRLADGVSFVHAAILGDGCPNPLGEVPAFRRFQQGLAGRCDVQPLAVEGRLVGRYRLFTD